MHTDRRLRGEIGQDFTVYESNDSRRATFDWDVGQHYLLFLISSATSDKSWSLDNCGNLGQLNWAQTVSAQIQKTGEVDHKYGAISRIVGHDALSNPIPGVLVEGSATNRHLLHHDARPREHSDECFVWRVCSSCHGRRADAPHRRDQLQQSPRCSDRLRRLCSSSVYGFRIAPKSAKFWSIGPSLHDVRPSCLLNCDDPYTCVSVGREGFS